VVAGILALSVQFLGVYFGSFEVFAHFGLVSSLLYGGGFCVLVLVVGRFVDLITDYSWFCFV